MTSSSSSSTNSNSNSNGSNIRDNSSKYDKVRQLGSGTFGTAWLVRSNRSGRYYVAKELKMSPNLTSVEFDGAANEVKIIKSCWHANIIKYKDFFMSSSSVMNIVMEYADGGDLHEHIRRQRESKRHMDEAQIRNWLVQITFALQYLHKHNILHRDLKTQNIFLTKSGLVKLGDFGISRTLSHENDFATTRIGTPQYLSPEVCRMKKYDYKTDIWGLGCVLYEMCALVPAFSGEQDWISLFQSIIRGAYRPLPQRYSSSLEELIKVMLRPDPSRRPTADQVLGAKVLWDDVVKYFDQIKNLPTECGGLNGSSNGAGPSRKGSSSSVSSAELSVASSGGGSGGIGGGWIQK